MKRKPPVKLLLLIILTIALFFRLVFLDRLPNGISNDEYYFLLNSKSVFYDFLTLIKQGWNFDVFQSLVKGINSETSILLFSPLLGIFPSTLFFARLPYALIGVASVYLIYLITFKYTRNFSLSLLASLVMALNPWSIYVSRTSFDAPLALFFFLLTIYLQSLANSKYIYLSTLTSLLAFNAYIGTKVIYLPFMLSLIYYSRHVLHHRRFSKSFLFCLVFSLLVTLNFVLQLSHTSTANRLSEINSPYSSQISLLADQEKIQSLSTPLNSVFTNRFYVYLRFFVHKYINNFSPQLFFTHGDDTFMVSLWKMGYFYYLDFVFFFLGIIYLFNRHRSFFYLMITFILLSPIPEAIRTDPIPAYAFHSAFQYPFLFIILAAGIYYFWILFKSKIVHYVLVIAYSLLLLNFINLYFFKYPVYQSEAFFMSRRLLAVYLNLEQQNNRLVYVSTSEPEAVFRNYLYFSHQFNYQSLVKIRDQYRLHPGSRYFQWGSLTITDHLPDKIITDTTYIVDGTNSLPGATEHLSLVQLGDQHELYKIYFSKTCQNIASAPTTTLLSLADLSPTQDTETHLCQKFLHRYF